MLIVPSTNRRAFLGRAGCFAACALLPRAGIAADDSARAQSLFDGKSLDGWTPKPRGPVPQMPDLPAPKMSEEQRARIMSNTGRWVVEDGAIVGGQEPPGSGLGAYLVSERAFRDFDLELEARPDWRADTGIMIRASSGGGVGIQVLCDHRPGGGIGGFYFNGTGGFLAAPFFFEGETDSDGKLKRLFPSTLPQKQPAVPLDFGGDVQDFLAKWRVNGWNHFRIRCIGELPQLTTWVNDVKVAELDLAKLKHERGQPERVRAAIAQPGHIAFEVHNIANNDLFGQDRWSNGAVCRWRNIRVKEL